MHRKSRVSAVVLLGCILSCHERHKAVFASGGHDGVVAIEDERSAGVWLL